MFEFSIQEEWRWWYISKICNIEGRHDYKKVNTALSYFVCMDNVQEFIKKKSQNANFTNFCYVQILSAIL